jgi:uncharacterized membrane protein YhaH (DUF805 family)
MMTFFESVNSACYKSFQFSGRSVRSEYWYFILFIVIVDFFLSFLDAMILDIAWIDFIDTEEIGALGLIFTFATIIPSLSVCARRLHDVNRSGWWMLIPFTILGIIPFVYWMCKVSDIGENRFGAPPFSSDNENNLSNTSISDDIIENPINDGPWVNSSEKLLETETDTSETENELKKIDDLFKKSLITNDEKKKMRDKILGLS